MFGKGKCWETILWISESSTTFSQRIFNPLISLEQVQGKMSSARGHGQSFVTFEEVPTASVADASKKCGYWVKIIDKINKFELNMMRINLEWY